ncbi:ABC transporter permease [Streptosporangium roseum]|uniref:Binding-protein-dependent transport systems inner membrane component n=1 Tax=Streptosporangium roseum (strain ATCC 12428 / DSM 43021 / JCM 3005 / KCTC 9067 / NCIMB 10171 / NRRL 2505 / NI 9100) TaxID=479432 RepID=D2B9X6_STRRD|nr:ABC transporter permease [Streptosporangium roseum]ACZ85989.1 binding-protein-dependent transport systems inner membrane component [Streptosporangium roseum DSM 43021]
MTAPTDSTGRPAPALSRSRRPVRLAVAALVLLGLAVLLVPPLVQLDQQLVDLRAAGLPPSPRHPLGTDQVGRDVLLRSIYGLRVSFLVGLVAALVSMVIGGLVGLTAGSLGGTPDRLLMRVVDGFNSVPHLLFGIFIVALFAPSPAAVVVSVGVTHWTTAARIVRSEVLSLRSRPFVEAAISGGASRSRVVRRHLLPHLFPHLLLATVLMVPHAIWHETALSFLGLGLPAHLASLGNMINDGRHSLLTGDWWSSLVPGVFILVPTLAVAVLAQHWRDRLSPRHRSELSL